MLPGLPHRVLIATLTFWGCEGLDALDRDPPPAPCEGVCRGNPPSANLLGVCADLLKVCDPATCEWVDPQPNGLAGYEALERSFDGRDNDCDSRVDEHLQRPSCELDRLSRGRICETQRCELSLNSTSAELSFAGEMVTPAHACPRFDQLGWNDGKDQNNIRLRWTHATNCPPPEDAATIYSGRAAHWRFEVECPGRFDIRVKVPSVHYLCPGDDDVPPASRYATGVRYSVTGPGHFSLSLPFSGWPYAGDWMPVFEDLALDQPGEYVLTVYDASAVGGHDCADLAIDTPTEEDAWIFVDSVQVLTHQPR